MPTIELPLTWEQYVQLPRNPAYQYQYQRGRVFLTPQARFYHAVLDLRPPGRSIPPSVRLVQPEDFDGLAAVFTEAFRHIQPFGSLGDGTRYLAARDSMLRTRDGEDGPVVSPASHVAVDEAGRLEGAALVTLLPDGDPCDQASYSWAEPPPPDLLERRGGKPHLTWIFVSPLAAGAGVGTALLDAAAQGLLDLGYPQLYSTFVLGNESSMLWHWRRGFRLLPFPGPARRPLSG